MSTKKFSGRQIIFHVSARTELMFDFKYYEKQERIIFLVSKYCTLSGLTVDSLAKWY